MKRLVFLFISLVLLGFGVASQNVGLENIVVPPKYVGDVNSSNEKISFSDFMNNELANYDMLDEGVVIMLFTVEPDGSVTDFKVEHSSSAYNTSAISGILKSSKGMWRAGSVNGVPVQMNKEIIVKLVDPENGSLEEMAITYLSAAQKKFYQAENYEGSLLISKEKAERKSDRKLKSSIRSLDLAYNFVPRDIGVVFWQCKVYENLGDDINYNKKFNEYQLLTGPSYNANTEDIVYQIVN